MAVDLAAADRVTQALAALDEETARAVMLSLVAGALAGAREKDALLDMIVDNLDVYGALLLLIDHNGAELRGVSARDRIPPDRVEALDRMIDESNTAIAAVLDRVIAA